MPSCATLCHPSLLSKDSEQFFIELIRKFSCLGIVTTKKHNLLWPPGLCIIVTVQREGQRGGGQGTMVLVLGPKSNSWACMRNANPEAESEFVLLEPLHTHICYTYGKCSGALMQNNHTCQNKGRSTFAQALSP